MLSEKLRGTAQYFNDRSASMLILGPSTIASIVRVLTDYACQAEALEAKEAALALPDNAIRIAEKLHRQGVRLGMPDGVA